MAKRYDADDAINAAISGVVCVRPIVDVVFGGDGGVRLGDVFYGFNVVIQDANAAEAVATVGFKDGNVVRVGCNGATLNQNEGVRVAAAVLDTHDAETFIGHGVCFALVPFYACGRNKEGERQRHDISARAVQCYDRLGLGLGLGLGMGLL